MLVFFGGAVLSMVQLAYPGGLYAFLIDTFAYNQQTGWGRIEILDYGSAAVLRHPLFGIGLSRTGARPGGGRRRSTTYWLVVAMRYGLPALAFIWAGHRAARGADHRPRRGLTEQAASYRKGYLIALAGLFVVLGTVHIWGAVSVFIMFYLGAGAWFYSATPRRAPVRPRSGPRRRARRRHRRRRGAADPAADGPGSRRRATARQDLPR